MNQDAKKTSKKEKRRRKKLRDKTMRVVGLWEEDKYQECLDYINSLGDEGLKILLVFSIKVRLHGQFKQHEEVLALQERHKEFGHEKTLSYLVWFTYAYCNRKKNNFLEAYSLYQYVRDQKDVDDDTRKDCVKWIKELQSKVQPELDKIALERASRFLDDEPGDSSAVAASSSAVAASSSAVAASLQKMMKFSDDGTICFEMVKLDENSCLGIIKIGGGSFPKSYIKLSEDSISEISINLKKNPCLLKIEFSVYSPLLSCMVAIVEPVHPIKVFFELELENFKTTRAAQTSEEWWKYIKDSFRIIFRGIICGMFAIYSAQEVCGDLETSMYVTKEREGRIFYISRDKITYNQVQKELDDLLSTMESVITLISPRRRPDLQTWLREFEVSYELPEELHHFLMSLKVRKIQHDNIQPTWLIDHPFIWSVGHRISFFEFLDDVINERLIDEQKFIAHLTKNFSIMDWKTRALNDKLLEAIYNFKGDSYYDNSEDPFRIINFIHAIFVHANDYTYDIERGHGQKGLTPEEKEMRLTKVFPSIYTILYDTVCDYAQNANRDQLNLLSQALKRFSSCVSHH